MVILNYVFKIAFDGKDAKLHTSLKLFCASLQAMWLKTADVSYHILILNKLDFFEIHLLIPFRVH